jgi:hypothetical protein
VNGPSKDGIRKVHPAPCIHDPKRGQLWLSAFYCGGNASALAGLAVLAKMVFHAYACRLGASNRHRAEEASCAFIIKYHLILLRFRDI